MYWDDEEKLTADPKDYAAPRAALIECFHRYSWTVGLDTKPTKAWDIIILCLEKPILTPTGGEAVSSKTSRLSLRLRVEIQNDFIPHNKQI